MNRLEDAKRCLQIERVEQNSRQTVEELRSQIEEKEHRAKMNYLALQRLKANSICQGSGSRNKAIEKAQLMHAQLLHGLEEWHKKVLELHLAAQDRAEVKYLQEINRRKSRVASERILREERTLEMMRRVKENEDKRRELVLHVIDSKENKAARLKEEKERKVQISRIRAQQAAELRQQLREKLDPETFDKKAARVELELRVLRKPQTNLSCKFVPRLHLRRCSHCRCRRN
ncbi:unnamed protein product [Allacma fusca]|uniref:Uncharacterized protein n=1 Tax=Allacma fusca TaxID=39272 RepID=A0A8J2Q7T8_9HEXA|nr:unnamed protein product [Allacma fusca]